MIHSFISPQTIQFKALFNINFIRNIQFKKLFINLLSRIIQFKNWFKILIWLYSIQQNIHSIRKSGYRRPLVTWRSSSSWSISSHHPLHWLKKSWWRHLELVWIWSFQWPSCEKYSSDIIFLKNNLLKTAMLYSVRASARFEFSDFGWIFSFCTILSCCAIFSSESASCSE